jgi:hypothetical protein
MGTVNGATTVLEKWIELGITTDVEWNLIVSW